MNKIGVAISTTGDPHRLPLLYKSITMWLEHLPQGSPILVTVDGDLADAQAVYEVTPGFESGVYLCGQPREFSPGSARQGVAVNKNTGIELLMNAGVHHLFLSDDDTWPLRPEAIDLHLCHAGNPMHSMVCWGKHRLRNNEWTWPRGSMLYAHWSTLREVGGMIEEFGAGGHEHVEWSRRIYQAGLTDVLYPTPDEYKNRLADGARKFWHAEDMPRLGEPLGNLRQRRRHLTSVRRAQGDWPRIEKIMADRDGDTSFVPYTAAENGRTSATLYHN